MNSDNAGKPLHESSLVEGIITAKDKPVATIIDKLGNAVLVLDALAIGEDGNRSADIRDTYDGIRRLVIEQSGPIEVRTFVMAGRYSDEQAVFKMMLSGADVLQVGEFTTNQWDKFILDSRARAQMAAQGPTGMPPGMMGGLDVRRTS